MNNLDQNIKELKLKLRKKKLSIGSWITLGHSAIAEIMANAGFEWLVVDLEHSVISLSEAEGLVRTIGSSGSIPLVRLPSNDPVIIKRVLDAGALGIIVPQVTSRKEATKAITSAHYPPKGDRGVGLARAQGYGASFDSYKQLNSDGFLVIAQIEHIDAVNCLEEIIESGIDAIIIGPYDLSASMGIPGQFNEAKFINAIEKIIDITNRQDFPLGVHIVEPDLNELDKRVEQGFSFIAYSLDIRMIDKISREALQKR